MMLMGEHGILERFQHAPQLEDAWFRAGVTVEAYTARLKEGGQLTVMRTAKGIIASLTVLKDGRRVSGCMQEAESQLLWQIAVAQAGPRRPTSET